AHLRSKLLQFKNLASDVDISRFKLVDFGTRRRFSQGVQQAIVSTMKAEFPYLAGTSNYDLAHLWDLAPV
ncbi:MAG: nicotinate phosphoribosyltransferase, partial [Serratia symbiotica]|nr:nicotinate phosphoribosyltransferase [Serratia symbiotica]